MISQVPQGSRIPAPGAVWSAIPLPSLSIVASRPALRRSSIMLRPSALLKGWSFSVASVSRGPFRHRPRDEPADAPVAEVRAESREKDDTPVPAVPGRVLVLGVPFASRPKLPSPGGLGTGAANRSSSTEMGTQMALSMRTTSLSALRSRIWQSLPNSSSVGSSIANLVREPSLCTIS